MLAWFKSWRERRALKKLARQMGPLLRKRYGRQNFYTSGQVVKTSGIAGLDSTRTSYAVAMYAEPKEAETALQTLGASGSYLELRSYLLEQLGKTYHEDNFAANEFVLAEVSSGPGSVVGSFYDSSGGGHSGGDSGSGHH